MKKLFSPSLFPIGAIGILLLVFLFRAFFFAATVAGVEHDSGWYLGVAKNLALRGIYASYTNTIIPERKGAFPSIHGRFSVQDENGYVYFPAGVTVGPGYVIPEALILKLAGNGWWQYRAWPFLSFTLVLFLMLLVVWRFGGWTALLIMSIWLWVVPQFTIEYTYEAYSEDIAFLFLLGGFFLLYLLDSKKRQLYLAFFSGLLFAASYLTKTLFLLPILGVVVYVVWDGISMWNKKWYFVKKWFLFFLGIVIPVGLFWVYEYWFLISHFGITGWNAVQADYNIVFTQAGSGINNLALLFHPNVDFVYKKLLIWMDVGISQPLVVWILFVLSAAVFYTSFQVKEKRLLFSLYAAGIISFFWFIFLSPTGWARHAWQALAIGMICISIMVGQLSRKFASHRLYMVIGIGLLALSVTNFHDLFITPVLSNTTVRAWAQTRGLRGLEGFPSTPILSLADQKDLIAFFNTHIRPEDRVYYLGWFINAESAALVDKVFYSLDRYLWLDKTNPYGGRSYVIIGPYQQGMWSFEPPSYVPEKEAQICKEIVFNNPSYIVCELRTDIVDNNPAY